MFFSLQPVQKPIRNVRSARDELDETMFQAVVDGDLEQLKVTLAKVPINLDDRLRAGYPLLIYACSEGHPHIVEYLIWKGATINMEVDSYTPLMMACRSEKDSDRITEIVKQLLDNGAVINQSNLYGDTPLIFACQNGHTEVVRLMVKDASLDACNNQFGNSAIFFAVEKNYLEIVKILLEHGASYNITNLKGYLPKAIAEMHGFSDIVDLFPKEEEQYQIPCSFLTPQHYTDLVPGVLGKPNSPPYFYRVREILIGLQLETLLPTFAKASTSLPQFLTMNEQNLEAAGVTFPVLQKKVLSGLFTFHEYAWSKESVSSLTKGSYVDSYHVYSMLAGHMQHLVVLRCSLVFLYQLMKDRNVTNVDAKKMLKVARALDSYLRELNKVHRMIKEVRRTSAAHLLDDVTPEKAQAKPKQNVFLMKLVKYSTVIGVVTLVGILLKSKLK